MTQKKLRFRWIDDDEYKVQQYCQVLEHGPSGFPKGAMVSPMIVKKTLLDELGQLTTSQGTPPDLVIIDHVFSQVKNMPLKLKGSSVAHLLRVIWPKVPMVCVTAALMSRPNRIDQEDLSEYTAVFEYGNMESHIEEIYAIARDFSLLEISGRNPRGHLADIIGVPASERPAFLRAFPEEFGSQPHATTYHRVARWIFNTLMVRPGFLYNRLRAATYMGLSEAGFAKVENIFKAARYKGPFNTESNPLWWVSELPEILFSKVPEDSPDDPRLAGRLLPNIKKADYSECYVNADPKDIPDVVARLSPGTEERAVCAKYTQPDPNDVAVLPGFEALLIVSGKN